MIKDNPDLLPQPKVNIAKAERWNKQHLQSAITQGLLQGESIPKIAKRMQRVTNMDRSAAIRNARTAMTGAQNGGRLDAMKRAQERGIAMKKGWLATLDGRTRDSHAAMDGEEVELDETFSNGLMFPGDANGEPSDIYNCRCRMVHVFDKYKTDWSNPENRNTEKLGAMSYQEWKDKHQESLDKKKHKEGNL
jgi:SPP1 gp7 family putative phage head morphogenesis protein